MPLIPSALSQSLQSRWLPRDDKGPFHDDAAASAQALAGAIAEWFALAMASGIPCATASARQGQLQSMLLPFLQAGVAPAAGQGIAISFMAYVAGQSFGPGVAAPPIATSAAAAAIGMVLADLNVPQSSRADQIAAALHAQALSSIVTFPPPMPPSPVM
ncbi:hypothetical protein RM190_09005 [Paracoccus sp. CPCC 101403]|uniref:Uncharacterized protein n=2 Tax=Paracoccus broussonetiae TaxID=3075834 RepID=A0ABU3ECP8_9RHOB|nr:hypothetical protein [Paracoccus sp. CPCC 101403]MDT1061992.1 hypothetical protein [Paracoccus sp. CPCC 101403]